MYRELFITVDTQVDTIRSPNCDSDATNIVTEIKYHKDTKVMYMFVSSSKNLPHNITGLSVSPMYDVDGSVLIYDEVKYKTEKLIKELTEKIDDAVCCISNASESFDVLEIRNMYVLIMELKMQIEENSSLNSDMTENIDIIRRYLKAEGIKLDYASNKSTERLAEKIKEALSRIYHVCDVTNVIYVKNMYKQIKEQIEKENIELNVDLLDKMTTIQKELKKFNIKV